MRRDQYDNRRGELNVGSKLTAEDVRAIREARGKSGGRMWKRKQREDAVPVAVLAARYGVSGSAISNIVRRRSWAHIP